MAATQYNATVQKAYVAFYGRPADPSGLAYWTDKLAAAKGNLSEIIQAFGKSAEATALFGSKSNLDAINSLYQQIFGRAADPEGLLYYNGELLAGRMTLIDIAQRVIDGAKGTDVAIVTNRLTAAQSFTDSLDTAAEILAYQGNDAAASARTWMGTVAGTADSLTSATANIATTVTSIVTSYNSTSNPGQTFTLTTGTDTVNGTESNDTINAALGGTNSNVMTYSASDSLDGKGGTDTLYVEADGNVNLALVKSIENVRINTSAASTVTLPTDKLTTSLENISSTANVTFNSVTNGATKLALTGTGANTTTLTYASDALKSSADNLSVSLNSVNDTTLAISGATATTNALETITLTAQSDANVNLTITGAGTTEIKVAGAGDTDLSVTGASVVLKSIDASAATGGLTVGTVAGVTDLSITGGAGDDNITGSGNNATVMGGAGADTITAGGNNDVIDAGAGDDIVYTGGGLNEFDSVAGGAGTDTLALTSSITHSTTSTATQAGTRISGFEVLGADGVAVSVDVTGMTANNTITGVEVANSGSLTVSKDTTISSINFVDAGTARIASAGKQTVQVGEASDVANVSATLGTAATELTINSNALSTGTARNSLTVQSATGTANATVTKMTLAGANPLTVSGGTVVATIDASGVTANPASGYAVSVDVSASTKAVTFTPGAGAVSVTTGSGADAVTGTAGNDNFSTGSGADTVTGGAGNDTASLGAGADVFTGGTGNDTVSDAGADADSLDMGDGDDRVTTAGAGADTLLGGAGNDYLDGGADDDRIDGGAGNDTLIDGAGNDVVLGGDGNDTITISTGTDSVDAGAGNDTISITGLSAGDTIDGGAGTDSLSVTNSSTSAIAPNVTGIESMTISTSDNLTLDLAGLTDTTLKAFTVSATDAATVKITSVLSGTTVTISDDLTPDDESTTDTDNNGNIGNVTLDTVADGTLTVDVSADTDGQTTSSGLGNTATELGALTLTDAASVTLKSSGGAQLGSVNNTINGVALDDADTTSLTVTAADYSGLQTGNVTNSSALESVTVTAGLGTSSVGTIADAEALESISATASGASSALTLGAIGGTTKSAALTSIKLSSAGGATLTTGAINGADTTADTTLSFTTTGTGSEIDLGADITLGTGNVSSLTLSLGAGSEWTTDDRAVKVILGTGTITVSELTVSIGEDVNFGGGLELTEGTDIEISSASITIADDVDVTGGDLDLSDAGSIGELTITVSGDDTFGFGSGGLTIGGVGAVTITDNTADEMVLDFTGVTSAATIDVSNQTSTDVSIYGGSAKDTVTASAAGSYIATYAGADSIAGGTGNDTVYGGDGNDTIDTSTGANRVYGEAGADSIVGGAGADTLDGGDGNDTISGGNGNDSLTGGAGDDSITGGTGADTINGGAGNDTIAGSTGVDIIDLGTGIDTLTMAVANSATVGSTFTAGTSISTLSLTKVSGFGAGDTIAFSNGAYLTQGTNGTPADNKIVYLQGAYDATAKTFTVATYATSDLASTTNATLLVWDSNSANGTAAYSGIVLVGYLDTGNSTDEGAPTGLIGTGG